MTSAKTFATYHWCRQAERLWELRSFARQLIPHLKWRWHGIGLLQAYVHEAEKEGDPELRLHIWDRRLIKEGIEASGNVHNHRFQLRSTVLAGQLLHTEHNPTDARDVDLGQQLWRRYTFPPARKHTQENRALIEPAGDQAYVVRTKAFKIREGETYLFEKWRFHSSTPITETVVSLITKYEQENRQAEVLAPVGKEPVPAFAHDLDPKTRDMVIVGALAALSGA